MIHPSSENNVAALRIALSDEWTVEDLQLLFATFNEAYSRIAQLMMLGDLIRQEEESKPVNVQNSFGTIDSTWGSMYRGEIYRSGPSGNELRREPLQSILNVVNPFVMRLAVDTIHIGSPGWIQVLGSLNPLKVVADFVSSWRAENTKRRNIEVRAEIDRERIRTGTAIASGRIRSDFARAILTLLPAQSRYEAAARLTEIAEYVIDPASRSLERLTFDNRVLDVELVRPGAALPVPARRDRGRMGPNSPTPRGDRKRYRPG
jgi:hypothetical protein